MEDGADARKVQQVHPGRLQGLGEVDRVLGAHAAFETLHRVQAAGDRGSPGPRPGAPPGPPPGPGRPARPGPRPSGRCGGWCTGTGTGRAGSSGRRGSPPRRSRPPWPGARPGRRPRRPPGSPPRSWAGAPAPGAAPPPEAPTRSWARSSRKVRAPPWTSCSTAGTPSAWMARASRAMPGTWASSHSPRLKGMIRASASTAQDSTTTSPTPPRAWSRYHWIWAGLGAASRARPVTMGAITRRLRRYSPFTCRGSERLGMHGLPGTGNSINSCDFRKIQARSSTACTRVSMSRAGCGG